MKDDVSAALWGGFCILVVILFFVGSEKDGSIEYDDCREAIEIEDGSWRTWINDFVCDTSGACVHVDTYLFSHECKRAYRYHHTPDPECLDYKQDVEGRFDRESQLLISDDSNVCRYELNLDKAWLHRDREEMKKLEELYEKYLDEAVDDSSG